MPAMQMGVRASEVNRKIHQKRIGLYRLHTYMIIIHWQRHTQSFFIIFAAADDGVFAVVAIIFIGCVGRRQNGVCTSTTINVIHIECIQ